jgi:hypothetical protein
MNKKQFAAFMSAQGYSTAYSGKTRTMFVDGINQGIYNSLMIKTAFKVKAQ